MITNGHNGMYFMGEHIGSGSFGDVYECTDEWANPLVAKVLKPALPFEQVQAQWEAEVEALMNMRHPNITYIHDAFVFENLFYIVVEKCLYSLDRVLPKIDETWVPHIARDILQALSFIHRFGYVHKDVHPGNVFVSLTSDAISHDQGGPFVSFKLGDLGITKLEHEIRVTGTILAPWMRPPEAIEPSEYGVVGRQTDVYHTALLLLSVLNKEVLTFTEQDIMTAAPIPCPARATISSSSVGAKPQDAEAAENRSSPASNSRRRPIKSPSRPTLTITVVTPSRYARTTHWTC